MDMPSCDPPGLPNRYTPIYRRTRGPTQAPIRRIIQGIIDAFRRPDTLPAQVFLPRAAKAPKPRRLSGQHRWGGGLGGGVSDARCILDRRESHHARKVLRLSVGDPVEFFDGQGTLAQASIERNESGHTLCRITCIHHSPR